MTHGRWHRNVAALLSSACIGSAAAEPMPLLAFLRAAPQVEKSVRHESSPIPAAQAPNHAARRSLGAENFYDPTNPDLRYLQDYEKAMAGLPMDTNGFPDWMRALRESKIQPRTGMKPNSAMNILHLDVVMKNTKEMPFVRFPHYAHTLWLDCSNCHPAPFEAKAGSSSISMADIFRGKYCGMCHDRVAFITFFSCQRCHAVPQPRSAGSTQ